MKDMTPKQIVDVLDRYIVGQGDAKRAIAVAIRNRYRRLQLPAEMRDEVTPKNIMMIGPTGVGKTEIARRIAKMIDAPFIKVEATKFTEVGYVGRDVESIVRDLSEIAVNMVHDEKMAEVREKAESLAFEKLVNYLMDQESKEKAAAAAAPAGAPVAEVREPIPAEATTVRVKKSSGEHRKRLHRKKVAEMLQNHMLEEEMVEIELEDDADSFSSVVEFMSGMSPDEMADTFQEFLDNYQSNRRKRSRRVSVKEARRILTEDEAHKMIDFDSVVDTAIQRTEQTGVVFVDEIDKIVGNRSDTGADVSGEGVQRDLLPIVEGSTVSTRYGPVKTDHIFFVAAGSFHNCKPADLIPELQGRFPLRVELSSLSEDDLRVILEKPDNSLTKQYKALLETEGVSLQFTDDGLAEMARMACYVNSRTEDIGARRLHTVMERVLEDISFTAPERVGEDIVVDASFVSTRLNDLIKDEDLSKYIL